jgi:hypothetical protein
MKISAFYACPVRGMMQLEPPDPRRLEQAARTSKSLGLEKLFLPVMEASLAGSRRAKIAYLDGMVQALDRGAEAGVSLWLIAPCHRALGIVWPAPHMVTPTQNPDGDPVFLDGRVRYLRAFDWWSDPSLVQKRILSLREVVSATQGHPALSGWVMMDRDLEWPRPGVQAAEFVWRAFAAEVREKDAKVALYLGVGWREVLHPEIIRHIAAGADGLRIGGFEKDPPGWMGRGNPGRKVLQAAYVGSLARWLTKKPVEVETGWALQEKPGQGQEWFEAWEKLASHGLEGSMWYNLCDPEPGLRGDPPWAVYRGLEQSGLLDLHLNPKAWVEDWLQEMKEAGTAKKAGDFIDLSEEEYLQDPEMHFSRLWDHFI